MHGLRVEFDLIVELPDVSGLVLFLKVAGVFQELAHNPLIVPSNGLPNHFTVIPNSVIGGRRVGYDLFVNVGHLHSVLLLGV